MDHKTATYTSVTTRHWHRLFLCAGLLAALGVEDCDLGLVSIESPADGTTFTEAQTVTITASALEGEGLTVEEVRFYRDGDEVGTDTTEPYTYRWPITDRHNGTHRFYAEADYQGPGGSETLQSKEVVYEVALRPPPTTGGGYELLRTIGSTDPMREMVFDSERGLVVAVDGHALHIVDTQDWHMTTLPLGPRSHGDVAVHAGYVYVYSSGPTSSGPTSSLVIVDARNARAPTKVREIALGGGGGSGDKLLFFGPHYLYVTGYREGLRVYDVSAPAVPKQVFEWNDSHLTLGPGEIFAIGPHHMYHLEFGNATLFDVSSPNRPVDLGITRRFNDFYGVRFGPYFDLQLTGFVNFYDYSDPTKPVGLRGSGEGEGVIKIVQYWADAQVLGSHVILATNRDPLSGLLGLNIYEVTRPVPRSSSDVELLKNIEVGSATGNGSGGARKLLLAQDATGKRVLLVAADSGELLVFSTPN